MENHSLGCILPIYIGNWQKTSIFFPCLSLPDYSLGMLKYSVGYIGTLLPSELVADSRALFLEVQPYVGLLASDN